MHEPVMDARSVETFLRAEFPQMYLDGDVFSVGTIEPGSVTVGFEPTDRHLRPGGTVSGPTLFTLADVTAYIAVLAHVGPVALAVTTNLNINFLHRPTPGRLACRGTILKLGKRLVIVDCVTTDAAGRLVAQATGTYSIPPRQNDGNLIPQQRTPSFR